MTPMKTAESTIVSLMYAYSSISLSSSLTMDTCLLANFKRRLLSWVWEVDGKSLLLSAILFMLTLKLSPKLSLNPTKIEWFKCRNLVDKRMRTGYTRNHQQPKVALPRIRLWNESKNVVGIHRQQKTRERYRRGIKMVCKCVNKYAHFHK